MLMSGVGAYRSVGCQPTVIGYSWIIGFALGQNRVKTHTVTNKRWWNRNLRRYNHVR